MGLIESRHVHLTSSALGVVSPNHLHMTMIRSSLLCVCALAILLTSSCGLVKSAVRVPTGILKAAGRTVGGVARLTDAPDQTQASTEETKQAAQQEVEAKPQTPLRD